MTLAGFARGRRVNVYTGSPSGPREPPWQKLRQLPVVGRAADWGMGGRAVSRTHAAGRRAHRGPEGHRVRLPVLRRRLRPGRLHARRRARRHRGQPALADQPGHAVPEGLGVAASSSSSPAACTKVRYRRPGRHRVGGARPRDGDGHDRRARHRRPRERLAGRRRRGLDASTARSASPTSAARRSTTRRTTSSRRPSPRWARCRSRTRPAYDTPPRSPVWGPRSGAAAPPIPAGPPERRLHPDPGLVHGRGAPGRLPLGDEGARARREDHPRRPALLAARARWPTCTCRSARARDIAFLGGLIRHVLETESYFKDYVLDYTNAATIVNEDFQDTEDLGGLFCGFDPETGAYDRARGCTRAARSPPPAGQREHSTQSFEDKHRRGDDDRRGRARRDAAAPALRPQHPAPPLRALHARDGRAHLRHLAGAIPRGRRDADRQLRPRAHDARSATPSAGRSTPPACR